jgi:DeoR family fructose operon transcriptional repressor
VLSEERRARLVHALTQAGSLSTEELAARLEVSAETIRRDLVQLDREGVLRRIHGGATIRLAARGAEPSFAERSAASAGAKQRIGELAAGLITSDQTVVFDVGTTVLAVARALPVAFRGTVVTCSLLVAAELAGRPGVEVLIAPGRVRGGDLAVSNPQTVEYLKGIHADVALLGSGGIAPDSGVTDFYLDEVATRRVMVANSAATYVLADSSKFGVVATHHVCPLADVSAVVTDRPPSRALQGALRKVGAHVLAPD